MASIPQNASDENRYFRESLDLSVALLVVLIM